MRLLKLPATFMRGGTSKAIMFLQDDLPANRAEWDAIFLQALGSPDPYGRQLDGMGGGVSSLSKICIVGPSTRDDADVDYTFAQVSINKAIVDYSGNCGNMSSAIGPFAIEEGLVPAPAKDEAVVRIHNTNTSKIIVARFPVVDGALAVDGDLEIDGVAGTAAPIRLEFLTPGGAKTGRLLPTGNALDQLDIPGLGMIAASCVDAANPCIFIAAETVNKTGIELPQDLEKDQNFLNVMEQIRLAGSVKIGLAGDLAAAAKIPSIPKVAMVCPPKSAPILSGQTLREGDMDICVRMISVEQPHRAVPITGAICLAVATRIPDSIAHAACKISSGPIHIGHASGTILVDAGISESADGSIQAEYGAVYRSARRLFEGSVLFRSSQ